MVKEQAVVLLSSGLDSTINIYQASKEFNVKLALTFDYGQRARVKEIEMAKKTSEYLAIPHKVVSLPWFSEFTETSLVNSEKHIPTEEVRIDDLEASQQSAKSVWVPNRNGIFLNIAAAYAEGIGAKYVIPGFNLEEATTFSDNSQDFIDQLNRSFFLSDSLEEGFDGVGNSVGKRSLYGFCQIFLDFQHRNLLQCQQ